MVIFALHITVKSDEELRDFTRQSDDDFVVKSKYYKLTFWRLDLMHRFSKMLIFRTILFQIFGLYCICYFLHNNSYATVQ